MHKAGFRAEHACVVTLAHHPETRADGLDALRRIASRYRAELVPLNALERAASRHGSPLPDTLSPPDPLTVPRSRWSAGGPAFRTRLMMVDAKLHGRSFSSYHDFKRIPLEERYSLMYAFDIERRGECWAVLSATGWWNQLANAAQAYCWFAPLAWFSADADPIESFGVSVQVARAENVLQAPQFLAAARASGVRVGTYWGECPSLSLSMPLADLQLRERIEPLDEFARHALLALYNLAPPGFDQDAPPLGQIAPPQEYGEVGETLETASLTN